MKDINNKLEDTCKLKKDSNLYENFERLWQKHWFQYILDNPDKPWDYTMLSMNPNITWDIIENNPNKPWNYNFLAHFNPNITWEIVQANPNKPWDYHMLSGNP